MDVDSVTALLKQAHFFNQQWKACHTVSDDDIFAELMRISKNRCQLQLLKFFSADSVWTQSDAAESMQVGESIWLVGGVSLPDSLACHIPLRILQAHLSAEQLAGWKIS